MYTADTVSSRPESSICSLADSARGSCAYSTQPTRLSGRFALGVRRQGPARLSGRTGGAASRPLPRHKRATLTAGRTGGSHHRSPGTACTCADTIMRRDPDARAHARRRGTQSRPRLAVRQAHLGAAPRAGSSAPSRRGADSRARRTRRVRVSPPGFHGAPLRHGDRQQASPLQPRHLQRRTPAAGQELTHRQRRIGCLLSLLRHETGFRLLRVIIVLRTGTG
jgi:hypothetical protein